MVSRRDRLQEATRQLIRDRWPDLSAMRAGEQSHTPYIHLMQAMLATSTATQRTNRWREMTCDEAGHCLQCGLDIEAIRAATRRERSLLLIGFSALY